jgi:tetratricopeptide (TPR) repeat protein
MKKDSDSDLRLMISTDRNIHAILLNSNSSNVPVCPHVHTNFLIYSDSYPGSLLNHGISEHVLNLVRSSGDQRLVCLSTFALASAHVDTSEYDTAERYFAESYSLLSQLGSRRLALRCGLELAQCRLSLDQPLQPIIEFLENLQVAFSDDSQRASIKWVLGSCLRSRGQLSEALDTLQEAKDLFMEIGDLAGVVKMLCDISVVQFNSSKFEESLASILEAREIVKSSGVRPTIDYKAHINMQYGRCLMWLGRHMEALPMFEESLSILESTGDWSSAAACLKFLGLVHLSQANYHVACAAFESAIAKYTKYDATGWAKQIRHLENLKVEALRAATGECLP